jgi:hypothetical protein
LRDVCERRRRATANDAGFAGGFAAGFNTGFAAAAGTAGG